MTSTIATVADVARRVGGDVADTEVADAYALAVAMVDGAMQRAWRPVPDAVYKECILSVAHACYDRTKSSHGATNMTTLEAGIPVRRPRDPKASIRTILGEYILDGLA